MEIMKRIKKSIFESELEHFSNSIQVLQAMIGKRISGEDVYEDLVVDRLKKLGTSAYIGDIALFLESLGGMGYSTIVEYLKGVILSVDDVGELMRCHLLLKNKFPEFGTKIGEKIVEKADKFGEYIYAYSICQDPIRKAEIWALIKARAKTFDDWSRVWRVVKKNGGPMGDVLQDLICCLDPDRKEDAIFVYNAIYEQHNDDARLDGLVTTVLRSEVDAERWLSWVGMAKAYSPLERKLFAEYKAQKEREAKLKENQS